MPTEVDPIVGSWYRHLDKGQYFLVVAFDGDEGLVETQHFDGDIEEISLESWYQQDIDIAEAPENWAGALDIGTKDDYGTEVTDTNMSDWSEPLQELKDPFNSQETTSEWEE